MAVTDPETPVSVDKDKLLVDGSPVVPSTKIYLAMNKPRGVVTTVSDEQDRRTVYDLLGSRHGWVGPVGRLDKASEGLLLLTNDSEWAARITDPRSHLDKTYHVQVNCAADDDLVARILAGVKDRGELLKAKTSRVLRRGGKNTWLEIVLDEGRNRHIRRLLEALGIEVLRLVRVAVGPLELRNLKKGEVRQLSKDEKRSLGSATS
jgi:23S rRNA pseudouridine2605 synthase